MNIFAVDENPWTAATMLGNKHVVKMILESAQMLCTAHHLLSKQSNVPDHFYKATHINHPCTRWVMRDACNYYWLYDHFCGLIEEYRHRYGKIHKCDELLVDLGYEPNFIEDKMLHMNPTDHATDFAQAMPEKYRIFGDPVQAYRNYYLGEKRHLLQYKNREMPEWVKNGLKE